MDPHTSFAGYRQKSFHLISLGCPRNLVDSEVMLGILLKKGYVVAENPEEADYIIVNSCGFLQSAREESLSTIGRVMRQKRTGAKVVVAGCMVKMHQMILKKHFPHIDYFLGPGDVEKILQLIEMKEQGTVITSARSYLEAGEVPRQLATPSHYAYLKVAEGCRKRCSYCIIPKIKGTLRSKPLERIVKEFRLLREQGVKEVILIAQDLGDWGKDLGYTRSDGLVVLLQTLLQEKGAFWLRLLYLYPDDLSPRIMQLMQQDPRLCPYLDMPIQHVNDEILRSMHRATSKEKIVEILLSLRTLVPEVSVRTSLIVGFPGETQKQFDELREFLQEHPIDQVGIFQFSPEPGSVAAALPRQISEQVKQRRMRLLAQTQQKVLKRELPKYLGKVLQVLVEGYHPDSPLLMRGRHRGQCPEIDSQVIINDGRLVGCFGEWYSVKITEVAGYDLVGQVCAH